MQINEMLLEVNDRAERAALLLCSLSDTIQLLGLAAEQRPVDAATYTTGLTVCLDMVLQEALTQVHAIAQLGLHEYAAQRM